MSLPFPSLLPVTATATATTPSAIPSAFGVSDYSSAGSSSGPPHSHPQHPSTPSRGSGSGSGPTAGSSSFHATPLSSVLTPVRPPDTTTSITTPRDYNDLRIFSPTGSGSTSSFRPDFRTTQEIQRDKAAHEQYAAHAHAHPQAHGHAHGPGEDHGHAHGPNQHAHAHDPPPASSSSSPSSVSSTVALPPSSESQSQSQSHISFDSTPIRPYIPMPITTSHTSHPHPRPSIKSPTKTQFDPDYFGTSGITSTTSITHTHSSHGHAHGPGDDHGHAHGPISSHAPKLTPHSNHDDHHGHSHGPSSSPTTRRVTSHHGHSHGPSDHSHADHGHSHGGHNDHGHSHGGHDDHDHGHSHGPVDFYPPKPLIEDPLFPRQANRTLWGTYAPVVWNDRDARSLAIYITAKLGFMCIQFLYGLWIHSLGLISSSFHTGFDAIALITALMALVLAKRKAKHPYAYGYERFEVVAGFTNACFLFFVATFLIIESFHTMYKPPEIHNDDLTLAMLGLCIDILGLILFRRYHTLRQPPDLLIQSAHQTPYRGPRAHDDNMHGVFLHAVADGFSHSALLVATWIVHWQGLSLAHGLSYGIVAILIVRTSTPLFKHTGMILAQTTPEGIKNGIDRAVQEIQFHDGVLECRVCHWWAVSPGVTVGSLHVRVRSDADDQSILVFINQLLNKYCTHLTIQIEKDPDMGMSAAWIQQKTG